MTTRCTCGAVGRLLPPDFGYEHDEHVPLVEWSGGNIGDGRLAVELLPASGEFCPGCRHRTGVYVIAPADRRPARVAPHGADAKRRPPR